MASSIRGGPSGLPSFIPTALPQATPSPGPAGPGARAWTDGGALQARAAGSRLAETSAQSRPRASLPARPGAAAPAPAPAQPQAQAQAEPKAADGPSQQEVDDALLNMALSSMQRAHQKSSEMMRKMNERNEDDDEGDDDPL